MDRRIFIANGTKASVGLAAFPTAALAGAGGRGPFSMARPVQNTTLRLNHNANPLGIPPKAHAAIMAAMDEVPHYPGPRDSAVEDEHVRVPQQVVQEVEDQLEDHIGQDQRDQQQQARNEAESEMDSYPLPRLAAGAGIGQSLKELHENLQRADSGGRLGSEYGGLTTGAPR